MWAVISTTKKLQFFEFKSNEFIAIEGVEYIRSELCSTRYLDKHDLHVSKILSAGIPLFANKIDARKEAVKVNLTGFKYLKLEPAVIRII